MNLLLALLLVLALLTGCDNAVATVEDATSRSVLVTSDRYGQFKTQLSLIGSGNNAAASVTVAGNLETALLMADSSTLLLSVVHADARRDLVAIDTRTLRERSRRTISNRLVPTDQGDIGLRGAEALAESSDHRWLYISQAVRGDVIGIARVDAQTNVAAAFSGPWNVTPGLVRVLPASTVMRDGAIAMVASRADAGGGPPRQRAIYLLHPLTLVPFDSLTPQMLGGTEPIINVLVLDAGATLLIGTGSRIVRFDLADRRITASVPRFGLGVIVPLADGQFAVLDQGRFPEFAGLGLIHLLDSQLNTIDSVDVSTLLGGAPRSPLSTVMGGGIYDENTDELYVSTGSVPFGPLYPLQRARIVVINVRDRRVVRVVPLIGDGYGMVFRTRSP